MLSKQHETTLQVPVTYINFPSDVILSSEPVQIISVRVKSPGFSILFYHLFSFKRLKLDAMVANLKYLDNGREVFWLMNSKRKKVLDVLGSSMEIVNIEPKRLSIIFNNKASKKVPVILQKEIQLKDNFWYSKPIELDPDSIVVFGQQDLLDSLQNVYTQKLSLFNLTEDRNLTVDLEEINGIKYEIPKIDVVISVESFIEQKITKRILVKNLEQGYSAKLFPEKVSVVVRAPKNKHAFLETDFFSVEVDAKDMLLESSTLDVRVKNIPSYIHIQRIYPERVEYLLIKE